MLIQSHFWKQRWCSGFDWAVASHEWIRVQIPRSMPYVGWLLVLSLVPKVFFIIILKNQHFNPLPFDLDHERTDTISSHVRKADSEISEIFLSGIRNPEKFACGIRNPGLWNPEYGSRNQESHYRLESRIQAPLKKIRNLRRDSLTSCLHAGRTIKREFLRTP